MAKIALTANYEFPERLLITRFVGCTEASIDLFELIYSICCQLKRALQMDAPARPKVTCFLKEPRVSDYKTFKVQQVLKLNCRRI